MLPFVVMALDNVSAKVFPGFPKVMAVALVPKSQSLSKVRVLLASALKWVNWASRGSMFIDPVVFTDIAPAFGLIARCNRAFARIVIFPD